MPRPRKNGLNYFPLDCLLNDKVAMLETVHGNDGFAVWIKLLQSIYQTDSGELDISSNILRMTLARQAHVAEDRWLIIVGTCVEVGLFDKELFVQHKLSSEGIRRRYRAIDDRRSADRNRRKKGGDKELPSDPPSAPEVDIFNTGYSLPSLEDIQGVGVRIGASPELCQRFYNYYQDAKPRPWTVNGRPFNWEKKFRDWKKNDETSTQGSRAVSKDPIPHDVALAKYRTDHPDNVFPTDALDIHGWTGLRNLKTHKLFYFSPEQSNSIIPEGYAIWER